MTILDAILLGIIQGLTEFLPVSSTAHLTLGGRALSLIDAAHPERWTAFIAVIQLGTLAAILIYFAKDLVAIVRGFVVHGRRFLTDRSQGLGEARLGWLVIVGTLPVVIIGLTFKKVIEGNLTKSLEVIGTGLIVLALVLWLAERVGRRDRTIAEATWKDALWVGLAQAVALIPGSSRSGTTITAALLLGMKREDAARFSFLLSVPAIGASGLLQLYEMRSFIDQLGVANVVVATIVSAVVGYASIEFLLRYLRTRSTAIFIFYRLFAGATIWALLLSGRISP
ncbi:MAG: undecaprenyl-diphosphatase UppP [Bacteroidetes bacterium]|jgi:undecaprenyl-diphosphatase|nr:undecaprenyl-diphosphatase UppP [Bacteroidota bacterium]